MPIVFKPWVGSAYRGCATRMMLIGESHYGEPWHDPSESTRVVVEKWKKKEWSIRYLVAAARVLTGLQRWQFDRAEVLEPIAFYNFVQVMMPWLDRRPTADEFRASANSFAEAIQLLDPTHIVVTGKEMWSYMPPEGAVESVKYGGEPLQLRRYSVPSGSAKAIAIPHLSRGFSISRWHPPVAAFLADRPAGTQREPQAFIAASSRRT